MPYVVTQSCCADASCVVACPVNCIHPAPGEPGFATAEMLFVDPESCVDCGACATACPVDAVVPHTRLSEEQRPFLGLAASYYATFPHRDRAPLAVLAPQRRLVRVRPRPAPARFAVVGAGPAGMYVADELLKHPGVTVDVFDRLPTPYGLVRGGVAPDHPHTREAVRLFAAIERERGFDYRLGVEVGRDVSLDELGRHYHGVVHCGGAAADRRLDVPGEDLPGSLSATALVGWYNAHPDQRALPIELRDVERVVVVGNGNVALDVARMLLADPEALARTDVADHALAVLRDSAVREVVVLGRRGPAQAAFTLPELIGLAGLRGVNVRVEAADAPLTGGDDRSTVLAELARRTPDPALRTITLRFLGAPRRILGETRVAGIEVVRTALEVGVDGRVHAVATGELDVIEAGLVLRAVGYHGVPVPGLPYDAPTGTVPSDRGRVRPGVYVAGWAKRGPTGFIGTNKADAQESVERILDDLDADLLPDPPGSGAALLRLLRERGVQVVGREGWWAVDAEERRRGEREGRPRARLTEVSQVLAVARTAPGSARRAGRVRWAGRPDRSDAEMAPRPR